MEAQEVTTIRNMVHEALGGRDDIGVYVVEGSLYHDPIVQLTRMDRNTCAGCDQPISTTNPGPATWFDQRTGNPQGGWSHQHGCGTWNSPCEEVITMDDLDNLPDAVETAEEVLDTAVAESVSSQTEALRVRLATSLRDALAERAGCLADGFTEAEADEQITTGSETDPGVYRDYDIWVTWAYGPLDGDLVTVTESEVGQ
jgi:hypothetical protein